MCANDDKSRMSANDDNGKAQGGTRLSRDAAEIRAAIAELKAFQDTHSLDGLSVREMIEEGRER